MVERSLRELGAGRSILIDKNGKVIAGNKTLEAASSIDLDSVVVVRTHGDKLVAVMREDLDLDEPTGIARRMAYADNRVAQVGIDFDPDVIAADLEAGFDFSDWFEDFELEDFEIGGDDWDIAMEGLPNEDRSPFQQMTFTLHDTQVEEVKLAIQLSKSSGEFVGENKNSNGNALARICEVYNGRG
jgi:hypothetical protein